MSAAREAMDLRRPSLEEEVRAIRKQTKAFVDEWRRQEEEELRQSVAGLAPKGDT